MMKASLLLGTFVMMSAAVPALPAGVSIDENHVTNTYDCAGADAAINGNHNVLTLENCKKVSVNGNHNTVTAHSAVTIALLGNHNILSWSAASGRAPRISDLGTKNVVSGSADDDAETAEAPVGKGPGTSHGGRNTARVQTTDADDDADEAAKAFALNTNGGTVTHDCKGGDAAVNGNENTLTLRNCGRVAVNGNRNTVDATVNAALSVLGNNNTVTWAPTTGAKPQSSNLGTGNRVTRR